MPPPTLNSEEPHYPCSRKPHCFVVKFLTVRTPPLSVSSVLSAAGRQK